MYVVTKADQPVEDWQDSAQFDWQGRRQKAPCHVNEEGGGPVWGEDKVKGAIAKIPRLGY